MPTPMFPGGDLCGAMPVEIIVREIGVEPRDELRLFAALEQSLQNWACRASCILQCGDGRMVLPAKYAIYMPLPAAAIAGENYCSCDMCFWRVWRRVRCSHWTISCLDLCGC